MEEKDNNSFIYVFSNEDRDALIACGYTLLKSEEINPHKPIYVFLDDKRLCFDSKSVKATKSNVLVF